MKTMISVGADCPVSHVLHTDGSGVGHGPGGHAVVISTKEGVELSRQSGGSGFTTVPREELQAVLLGLYWLMENHAADVIGVLVVTDSEYVASGVEKPETRKTNMDLWYALEGFERQTYITAVHTPRNTVDMQKEADQMSRMQRLFHTTSDNRQTSGDAHNQSKTVQD